MSNTIVDNTVEWTLVNIGKSGAGDRVETALFNEADWVKSGNLYKLNVGNRIPLAVLDDSDRSVLFDLSGKDITLKEAFSGHYYYIEKVSGYNDTAVKRREFAESDWVLNSDTGKYELSYSSNTIPMHVFNNSSDGTVMFDLQGGKIVLREKMAGYYYYKEIS